MFANDLRYVTLHGKTYSKGFQKRAEIPFFIRFLSVKIKNGCREKI